VGIVSARPFTVLGEYGPPTFQRGVLHVYFEGVALHVLVVHLHAHSSTHRISEAYAIVKVRVRMRSLSAAILHMEREYCVCGLYNVGVKIVYSCLCSF
jgi:endonuclease/exonuclease/phosphatase family metal-dependent hydrolase